MAISLAAAVTSFVIAFLALPVIIKYSVRKNLLVAPDHRKVHTEEKPSLGGVAIFAGFFISALIWVDLNELRNVKFILVPFVIIFFTGLRDDLVPLRPIVKLSGQVLAAAFLLTLLDLRLHSFYGLLGIEEWPIMISYVVTIFTIIVITNSFNLIDGLDGLAGSIGLVSMLTFGIWYYLVGDTFFSILCFAMSGAIIAFLIFNWEPSEIFMGDTGSMVIGLLLAMLVIRFINLNYNLHEDNPYRFDSTITSALCIILVPLYDTLRIVLLRLSKKQSPFKADKTHIHHLIMRLGMTHSRTTRILTVVQVLYILLAIFSRNLGDRVMLPVVGVLSVSLSLLLDRQISKRLSSKV